MTALLTIIVAVVLGILGNEGYAWLPTLARWILRLHTRNVPFDIRQRLSEEWQHHLDEIPGNLGKVVFSIDLTRAVWAIRRDFRPKSVKSQPDVGTAPNWLRAGLLTGLKLIVSLGLLTVLFARSDVVNLWRSVRMASLPWVVAALGIYMVQMLVSTWRWALLLSGQGVRVPGRSLLGSYLVAGFFNNFLPSNIGGDVIRVRDTTGVARSKTRAVTTVLLDRTVGMLALALVAAIGASTTSSDGTGVTLLSPPLLWAAFILMVFFCAPALVAPRQVARQLRRLAAVWPFSVHRRVERIAKVLSELRDHPGSLMGAATGAIVVQALLVVFYAAVARSLNVPVAFSHLAVIVPVSFVVQLLPVSVNGFGVREATFSFYFSRLGLPLESALALPLVACALIQLASLPGAGVYVARRTQPVVFR